MKKVSVFLALVLMCMFCITGVAEDGETNDVAPYRYSYTESISATLRIDSSGNASCSGTLKASFNEASYSLVVTLYKYDDGWTRVTSWSDSGEWPDVVEAGGTIRVARGYDYKVVSSGTIRNGSGTVLERPSATKTGSYR